MTHPTPTWVACVLVFSFVFAKGATVSSQSAQPSIYQRNTVAKALIGGSPKLRDGSYAMTGVSGICGEIPKEASLAGEATFVVEFASDGPTGPITAITFGSKQLVSGTTKATVFRLSVGVVTAAGGRPPHYVLNTDSPRSKATGTATLDTAAGKTTLTVNGQDEMGETIALTIICS